MHTQSTAFTDSAALYLRGPFVPQEQKAREHWLPWRLSGKKKVPLSPAGRPCDPHDPANWQRYEAAIAPYFREARGVSGVGFALDGSGFAIVDLDGIVDDLGRVTDPHAMALLESLASYSELSPSGRGVHIVLDAALPEGNRHLPGLDVLGSGFVTVTGHVLRPGPILPGGAAWEGMLAGLPPPRGAPSLNLPETLPVPTKSACDVVLARAMPNPRFRKLWDGHWTGDYPSRSEADGALSMHLARNGADLPVIVALLKASGLPREARRKEPYFVLTAATALAKANVRVSRQWPGVSIPDVALTDENARRRALVARLEAHPALVGREAAVLHRLAAEIASRRERGEAPDAYGFMRVSPQALAGDYPARPGCDPPVKLMSRRGCLKALHRLADAGVFDLCKGEDRISWSDGSRRHSRVGAVTRIRVDGVSFPDILTGFLHRLDASPAQTPHPPVDVTLLGTRFQSEPQRREESEAA